MSAWRTARIGEFCKTGTGGTPSRDSMERYYEGGTVPWVKSGELREAIINNTEEHVTDAALKETNVKLVPAGALLLAMYGATVGRLGILGVSATTNQAVCHIIPDPTVAEVRYLFHALRSQVANLVRRGVGGAQPNISQGIVKELALTLPPLAEQRRIAEVLDLAEALRAKRRAALAQLDALTQSIFLDLFGKPMSNERGWKIVSVQEAGRVQLGRQRAPQYQSGKHTRPYVRVANVYENRIDLTDVLSMDFDEDDFEAYRLVNGDILLNEGQSTELVGRPAMWHGELTDCCFQNTLVRFQPIPERTVAEFALAVFIHYFRSGEFAKVSSKTSNVAHLGAGRFAAMPFPLPPMDLQREFSRRLAVGEKLKGTCLASLTELDALFAVFQHRAFRGELFGASGRRGGATVINT